MTIALPGPILLILALVIAVLRAVVPMVIAGVVLVWILRRLGWWPTSSP